jgi:plasmid maintenance system antidote protein VapI
MFRVSISSDVIGDEEYPVIERVEAVPRPIRASCSWGVLTDGSKVSVAEAPHQLGVSRMGLLRVLRGEQAVAPRWRCAWASCARNGPELWIRLQMVRDLSWVERSMRAEVARIPTHHAA